MNEIQHLHMLAACIVTLAYLISGGCALAWTDNRWWGSIGTLYEGRLSTTLFAIIAWPLAIPIAIAAYHRARRPKRQARLLSFEQARRRRAMAGCAPRSRSRSLL